jgi:alpha-beta hydrolase superfamily lysophospholipase
VIVPLSWRHYAAPPTAGVVLVMHGGDEHGLKPPSRVNPPMQRMRPFQRSLLRSPLGENVGVAEVDYRCRGWNGERADAAVDAEEALAELVDQVGPGVPVVLLGHSMGGRASLRIGGHASVAGIVALAPWCPRGEPVEQLADHRLLIIHSDHDRVTLPEESLDFATRARAARTQVARCVIPGSDHAMARRAPTWHRLTTLLTGALLGAWPFPEPVAKALALTGSQADGLDLRLPMWAPGR